MNWTAVVAAIAVVNLIATVVGSIYRSGKESARIDAAVALGLENKQKNEQQDVTLGKHAVALAELRVARR